MAWLPLAAAHPQIPTHRVPASPNPAAALAYPPCRADQLTAANQLGGATGNYLLFVTMWLVGTHPCRLEGYPRVSLLLRGGTALKVAVRHGNGRLSYGKPVLLAPGDPAALTLSWASTWCGPLATGSRLRITLPGGDGSFVLTAYGPATACDRVLPSGGPSGITVYTFQPRHHTQAHIRSAYAAVSARSDLPARARAGASVRFVVTLTARKDVTLSPCPDFSVLQYAAGHKSRRRRYALNCSGVPFRDASDRPYLPAGTPVRFDMRATLLAADSTIKFIWKLNVPEPVVTGRGVEPIGGSQTGG